MAPARALCAYPVVRKNPMIDNKDLGTPALQARSQFEEANEHYVQQSEQYWQGLDHDQQLMAFCAMVRRMYRGELQDRGTYRWVLYDVFGFGPEAYVPAQLAGYLALHNSICHDEHDWQLIKAWSEHQGLDVTKQDILDWLQGGEAIGPAI